MLVYYFVPFVVSNRYLLFWVSNGHNSVTVQNWTHVYMNFFWSQRPRKSPPAVMPYSRETPCIVPCMVTSSQMWKVCWNKGRLCWKIAKLFYFCRLKKLVRPETFGPYYVCDVILFAYLIICADCLPIQWFYHHHPVLSWVRRFSSCQMLRFYCHSSVLRASFMRIWCDARGWCGRGQGQVRGATCLLQRDGLTVLTMQVQRHLERLLAIDVRPCFACTQWIWTEKMYIMWNVCSGTDWAERYLVLCWNSW